MKFSWSPAGRSSTTNLRRLHPDRLAGLAAHHSHIDVRREPTRTRDRTQRQSKQDVIWLRTRPPLPVIAVGSRALRLGHNIMGVVQVPSEGMQALPDPGYVLPLP
jgi:hypothetical protein